MLYSGKWLILKNTVEANLVTEFVKYMLSKVRV